jgi:hypothetical protein
MPQFDSGAAEPIGRFSEGLLLRLLHFLLMSNTLNVNVWSIFKLEKLHGSSDSDREPIPLFRHIRVNVIKGLSLCTAERLIQEKNLSFHRFPAFAILRRNSRLSNPTLRLYLTLIRRKWNANLSLYQRNLSRVPDSNNGSVRTIWTLDQRRELAILANLTYLCDLLRERTLHERSGTSQRVAPSPMNTNPCYVPNT